MLGEATEVVDAGVDLVTFGAVSVAIVVAAVAGADDDLLLDVGVSFEAGIGPSEGPTLLLFLPPRFGT